MRRCAYKRGRTDKLLARQWGLGLSLVQEYTREASRRVKSEIANEDYLDVTVDIHLENALQMATRQKDPRAVAAVAQQWVAIKRSGKKDADPYGVSKEKLQELIKVAAENIVGSNLLPPSFDE
jgi:hypothetical protein